MNESATATLSKILQAGVDAAHPRAIFDIELPKSERGRTIVIGAGKASAAMAQAFEAQWQKQHPEGKLEGLVVTRYGYAVPTESIDIIEAGHPRPDEASVAATEKILTLARSATENDLVVALISGGGSALLSLPIVGVSLLEKQTLTDALLKSGAPIQDINTVRQQISDIKGGGLLAACSPAKVITYIISDVVGNDPAMIASGPTIPVEFAPARARSILEKWKIDLSPSIEQALTQRESQTSKASADSSSTSARSEVHILATGQDALLGAAEEAQRLGINAYIEGDSFCGDSAELGIQLGESCLAETNKQRPYVLLSGGETTVHVTGNGKGGPNTEFLLSLAQTLDSADNVYAAAFDTDGTDGSENNAGAFITPDTLKRAHGLKLDPQTFLTANNAFEFFEQLGDLIVTGASGTNVNDLRAILIL